MCQKICEFLQKPQILAIHRGGRKVLIQEGVTIAKTKKIIRGHVIETTDLNQHLMRRGTLSCSQLRTVYRVTFSLEDYGKAQKNEQTLKI